MYCAQYTDLNKHPEIGVISIQRCLKISIDLKCYYIFHLIVVTSLTFIPHIHRLFSVDAGHTEQVFAVQFDVAGIWIASGSSDSTVKVWSTDGKCKHTLKGHQDKIHHVSWSNNSKYLASASADQSVIIWRA
jgi:WD40 repeat protein